MHSIRHRFNCCSAAVLSVNDAKTTNFHPQCISPLQQGPCASAPFTASAVHPLSALGLWQQESEGLARGMREACVRGNISMPPEIDNPTVASRSEAVLSAAARLRMLDAMDGHGPEGAPAGEQALANGHHVSVNGSHCDPHSSISSNEADLGVRGHHSPFSMAAPLSMCFSYIDMLIAVACLMPAGKARKHGVLFCGYPSRNMLALVPCACAGRQLLIIFIMFSGSALHRMVQGHAETDGHAKVSISAPEASPSGGLEAQPPPAASTSVKEAASAVAAMMHQLPAALDGTVHALLL